MGQHTLQANFGCIVFVGNISPRVAENDLRSMVEPFGTVLNINVVKQGLEANCRFAFVEMANKYSANRAIAELNGKSIDGRCLSVRLGF
jgi:RNA recognition motif-containing protein